MEGIPELLAESWRVLRWLLPFIGIAIAAKWLGMPMIRAFQAVDRWIADRSNRLAKITGATWRPKNLNAKTRFLRLLWFLSFFGAVFALALWGSVAQIHWLQVTAVVIGFTFALVVGRAWVTSVNRMLEDDRDDVGEAENSDQLRNMAIFSMIMLLLLTPLSLQGFQQLSGNQLFAVKGDVTQLETWSAATANLVLKAALDVADFINLEAVTENELHPREAYGWGTLLLLFHFLVLLYMVVNGIVLAARSDHAMHAALGRLKKYGETDSVIKFGSRILPNLSPIIEGQNPAAAQAAIRAVAGICQQAKHQFKHSRETLLRALVSEHQDVREVAAWGLGEAGYVGAVKPLQERLVEDKAEAVRATAAEALGKLGKAVAHSDLAERLMDGNRYVIEESERVRVAILRALAALDHEPNRGSRTRVRWVFSNDPSDAVRATAADTLRWWKDEMVDEELGKLVKQIADPSEKVRRAAATGLAAFVSEVLALDALRNRFANEDDVWARARIIKSLANVNHVENPKYVAPIAVLIRKALREDEWSVVRQAAAKALSEFQRDRVNTNILVSRMNRKNETHEEVRKAAAKSLWDLGETDVLVDVLDRTDKPVAEFILPILRRIHDRNFFDALRRKVDTQRRVQSTS